MKYKSGDGFEYITLDQIKQHHSDKEVEVFLKWMRGQTAPVIPGEGPCFFSWDYERWLSQGMKDEQGIDWD